jgi:hypothetical protein
MNKFHETQIGQEKCNGCPFVNNCPRHCKESLFCPRTDLKPTDTILIVTEHAKEHLFTMINN